MIPDELSPIETSAIWHSLTAEMQMAKDSAGDSYSIASLHVRPADGSTVGFDTTLRPGPVTDLISSACVVAQLELLKHAASIFGWATDNQMIDDLLAEAKEMNETSAQADPPPAQPPRSR